MPIRRFDSNDPAAPARTLFSGSRPNRNNQLAVLRAGTGIQQIRGINIANATGSGIPKHVTNVSTSMTNAQAGSTSTVTVTFRRDPSDKAFAGVTIFARGYQGNPSPTQVGSGADSPVQFYFEQHRRVCESCCSSVWERRHRSNHDSTDARS